MIELSSLLSFALFVVVVLRVLSRSVCMPPMIFFPARITLIDGLARSCSSSNFPTTTPNSPHSCYHLATPHPALCLQKISLHLSPLIVHRSSIDRQSPPRETEHISHHGRAQVLAAQIVLTRAQEFLFISTCIVYLGHAIHLFFRSLHSFIQRRTT